MPDDGLTLRLFNEKGEPTITRIQGVLGGALPGTPLLRRGQTTTVGDVLASVPLNGHSLVADANYQCLATDVQVGVKPLSAPRTIWLPDVDTFPFQDLVIADESGVCSDALTITILPGPSMDDVIGTSESTVILSRPFEGAWFRRRTANLWIRQ